MIAIDLACSFGSFGNCLLLVNSVVLLTRVIAQIIASGILSLCVYLSCIACSLWYRQYNYFFTVTLG
ncbi:hypothetical protein BROOK1789B_107 [Bathymodiolus brooksi thiotrophic gill symbiont]|nr:hypothetical protein BROOK1789B_107 [Bathymodiolus brooksi thiotrophic gill symbiont]